MIKEPEPVKNMRRRPIPYIFYIVLMAAGVSLAFSGPLLAEAEITGRVEIGFASGGGAPKLVDGKTGTKYMLKADDVIVLSVKEQDPAEKAPEGLAAGSGQAAGVDQAAGSGQTAGVDQTAAAGAPVADIPAADAGITGLYLIWDRPPGQWLLEGRNGSEVVTSSQGKNGYLHEYVRISPSEKVNIHSPGQGAVLCEVHCFAEDDKPGELPEWVQVWQPPWEMADLLLLPTHADDEHLFFGGTMPYYAGELGMKVQVAYVTHHWSEPYRPHELLDGLWTVGVSAYPVLGPFPDYYAGSLEEALRIYDEDRVLAYQVELLRRFRPLVVIGHDINGEYGHGVHMLNTYTLRKALELSADPAAYPESAKTCGLWEVPKVYLHLYKENPVLLEWDEPLERFGGRTGFEMAAAGYACHYSQRNYFSVRKRGVHDCRAFGLYKSLGGPDLNGGDFMEGLTPRPDPGQSYAAGFRLPALTQADYLARYGAAGLGVYFTAAVSQ